MLKRISLAAAACALAAVALAACGGGNGSDPSPTAAAPAESVAPTGDATAGAATSGGTDACTLMTADDAAAALGGATDVRQASPSSTTANGATVSSCSYFSEKGVAAILVRRSGAADAAAQYEKARSGASSAEDVEGVGERAYYNGQIGQLNVLVKDTWMILSAGQIGEPAAEAPAALIEVAKRAVERV